MTTKAIYLILTVGLFNIFVAFASKTIGIEICDNGIDDDKDGLIDLNDPDCTCQLADPPSLIPNPSFEEITCCPSGNSQLDCAVTWIQASEATTDYYNRCGYFEREQFPVPLPIPDGDAYIGFRNGHFRGEDPNPNWKEYTGACLESPLEAGTKYLFQFYIGFVDYDISPPMTVVLYGTPDCKNLPFGIGDRQFGCPMNGPGWKVLGRVHVSGNKQWRQYEISTTPHEDIAAIAIGPDCYERDSTTNPYYFLDNLILADSELFGPAISETNHPCGTDFRLTGSEKINATYQWYRDGIAVVGATSRVLNPEKIEGQYQMMARTATNCVISDPYRFVVPTFVTEDQITICPEETYLFGDQRLSRTGTYVHTFASKDGCDSTVQLDLVKLTEKIDTVQDFFFQGETYRAGPYRFYSPTTAHLTLTSSRGCDSLVYLTLEEYDLFIPNAFSPNGDGVNDYFEVFGSDDFIQVKSVRIYDRWGTQVFQAHENKGFRWDGTKGGQVMDGGIYIYRLDLNLFDGAQKVLSGDINLLR